MSEILEIKRVVKRFGGVAAVNGVSLSLEPGRIYGLIGPNGSGKTTLFNCITGVETRDEGEIRFKGRRIEFSIWASAAPSRSSVSSRS